MPEQYIGPYRLLSVLGQGPNSTVYKAWQQTVDRPVALKVLRKPGADELRRLQAEAKLTASLPDPRVRQVYEVGQTPDGFVYVALQYVDRSLRDVLNQRRASHQPFAPVEIVEILDSVAGVLDELHRQGLAHLDIKPENILMFKDTRHVVLADFGIVHKIGSTTQAGTPLYTSPEQAAGDRPIGPWSDVYSLALVAYEMVAGRPPFTSAIDVAVLRQHLEDKPLPLRKLRRGVAFDLDEAIAKALSKDPSKRFTSAGAFVEALRQRSTPVSIVLRRTRMTLRESPALALAPLLLVVVLMVGVSWRGPLSPNWFVVSTPLVLSPPLAVTDAAPTVATEAHALTTPSVIAPSATIMLTLTPLPRRTLTRTPTYTPTPAEVRMYAAPILLEPASGARAGRAELLSFTWAFDQGLKTDERFRFRFWQETHQIGEAYMTADTWRHTTSPAEPGSYEWGVDIVRINARGEVIQVLSAESDHRRVTWRP